MNHPLQQVIESMVISDQYLDREEEGLYWSAVERLSYNAIEAEDLLQKTLNKYEASRESKIYEELKVFLEGPLRDSLLDFEEEKSCEQWLLNYPHIPTGAHLHLIHEACEELGAHIASQMIDELIETFKSIYQMPNWDEMRMKEAIQWATQRWPGLTENQVFEIMDSFLD